MVRSYCECRTTAERCRLGRAASWSVGTPILPDTGEATDPSPSLLALLLELTGLEVASLSMLRSPPPRRRRRYGRDPRQQIRYAASPIGSGEIGMGGSPARAPCQKRRLPLPRSPLRAKFR